MSVPGMSYLDSSPKSEGKVKRKPVWLDPETLKSNEDKQSDLDIYFPSTLERDVYLHLRFNDFPGFEVHHKIELVPFPYSEYWECDFYFPDSKTIVEVKGGWIKESKNKAEKALFALQAKLACMKGYELLIVSDKAFKIYGFDVTNYQDLNDGWRNNA